MLEGICLASAHSSNTGACNHLPRCHHTGMSRMDIEDRFFANARLLPPEVPASACSEPPPQPPSVLGVGPPSTPPAFRTLIVLCGG